MSTETTNQADNPITAADRELQLANVQLQLANARSNAEYNLSVAGQIQRQFEAMQRCAKPYADSTIVPTSYRGNMGNCIIALDLAHRMNLPALTVMQNLYIVNGNPSWASKFLVASLNTSGRFTNIRYRKRNLGYIGKKIPYITWERDPQSGRNHQVTKELDATHIENWECVAYATEKATGEVLESDPVTIEMAIKEGWYTKDGSKWVTMPMLMLSYRAAAFFQRIYAPEISMGFRTTEEEEDAQPAAPVDVTYEDVTDSQAAPAEPAPASKPKSRPTTANVEDAKEKLRQRSQAAAPAADGKGQTSMFDMPS